MQFYRYSLSILALYLLGIAPMFAQIDFSNLTDEQVYRKENKYNTWSVTVGYGLLFYYTDVIDYTVFPKSNLKLAPSVIVSKQMGRAWGLDAEFITGEMYGEKNNRYFKGDFMDYSMNLRFSINQLVAFGPLLDKWDIYGKIGLGVSAFRSRLRRLDDNSFMQVNDVHKNLGGYPKPPGWDDNDFLVVGYNKQNPNDKQSRQTELVVPVGVGVRYRVNKSIDLGLESTMRNLTADNLDANFSGADNDTYLYTSFNLTYKIGKKNKRHARWTYKDFNLAYESQRAADPLAIRLDSLKSELDKLAGLDSIITTKSYQKFEKVVYEEGVSASVFFDFDKYNLKKSEHRQLARVARTLKRNESINMVISGYCDDRGSFSYNLKLSERRCNAVLDAMVNDFGIDARRFRIDPKGKSELLSDTQNKNIKGLHMANRRVDLLMIVNDEQTRENEDK
ncbi:OmpA family protein [Saccharicrinis carchari]|uniref:OmpA family protein n=1 Tax=Saccharicrinis carchari TaxID=1168039 RepID=A0A521CLH7_SACCC|nr:OmpA family protein [Saccharicrinis carchari]SMO60286.1 OmpA family protein [Saccharicrinis carchari]